MPRPRFEKLPIERKKAILEAAAKELASRGFEGTSLNRILEAANLSKGAAYYYFDDKEDLLATMFVYLWDKVTGEVQMDIASMTAETFWPSIQKLGEIFMTWAESEPWLMSAAKEVWSIPHAVRSRSPIRDAYLAMEQWMFTFLKRGQELGVVRMDIPLGLLLAMVLGADEAGDRWVLEHFEELGNDEVKRIWSVVMTMWRRMISPDEV